MSSLLLFAFCVVETFDTLGSIEKMNRTSGRRRFPSTSIERCLNCDGNSYKFKMGIQSITDNNILIMSLYL